MKKFYLYSLLTSLLLLCSTVASAHDFEVDGIFYNITSSTQKTVAVTYSGSSFDAVADVYSGIVTIPSTVTYNDVTYNVTSIEDSAFRGCTEVVLVKISEGIKIIGDFAFYGCSSLVTVTIPNSVTSIGGSAFRGCMGLTSINIPNSVTSIGGYAFNGCTGLTSVTIPNSVTSIGDDAFSGCSGLTAVHITDLSAWYKIDFNGASANPLYYGANLYLNGEKVTNLVVPSDITEIKSYAFSGCSGLTDITFHDNVMLINQSAFCDCSGLTNVTIGSGVMVLGANAFADCSNLRCVTIPNSVISIGGSAFHGCRNLYTVIDYSDLGITKGSTDNGYVGYYATHIYTSGDDIPQDYIFETIDGVNTLVAYFGKSNDVVLPSNYNGGNYAIGDSVFYNSSITSIKIPNSVTTIGDYAFYKCTGLTSVAIPNSVTSVGERAFYDCSGLTSITIPNSVTTIGDYAFYKCTGLTSITIPNNVTTIGSSAFSGCTGLTSITIPNNVTTIGSSAFSGCTGLTSITIPNSVTSIGGWAFFGCSGLTEIYVKATTPPTIADDTFYNCYSATLYVPAGSKAAYQAANYWNRFTNIIEEIQGGICGDDATWILRDSTLTISGSGAMYNYTDSVAPWSTYRLKIKEVVVNDSVTSIGNRAFMYCSGLTSVEIPNSVTSIGGYAFYGCTGLTSVTIPNSVTTIENSAFEGCRGLTSITIPNSVTSIGDYAFYGCTGLTSVTIPNSVTSIGNSAFSYCTGLTSVTIPNSVTSIGNSAFYGCTGLEKVEINTTTVGSWFKGCTSIKEIIIGDSVASIGEQAFSGCTGLTSVTIPNSVTSIGDYAFNGCTGIKNVRIEDGDTKLNLGKIGIKGLFYYCPLESLYLGRNLNYSEYYGDGYSPFAQITTLTSVTIGDNVNSLNTSLFKDCSNLNAITIPESVQIIEDYVFQYCDLREIHIPAGVTTIGDYAFSHNNNLEKITAAKENTRYSTPEGYNVLIDNNTIYGSTLVLGGKGAIIPDGIVSIGDGAFNGIHGITSITIPASVEAIGSYAFEACSDLTEIYCLSETPARIYSTTFQGLYGTVTLYVPAGSKAAYQAANYWKNFTNIVEIIVPGDIDGDGTVDVADVTALVGVILNGEETEETPTEQTFEDWTSTNAGVSSSTSQNSYTLEAAEGSVLTFDWSVRSESNYDWLIITIDGTQILKESGSYTGSYEHTFTTAGTHTLVAKYTKDGSVNNGSDQGKIYNIKLGSGVSNKTNPIDVDGDGTVDVADVTSLVSIILGTDTANAAPAKAAATRAGEVSTVSADGDGSTLLINIDNPGYPFSAIQFDLELPEGIEVDFDGEYYAVDLGSRTNSRKHSYPECAIQPDGSLRVVIISMSNALYNGTEGDVATATLKVNGATDGDYQFTIKNVVLSAPGSKEKLEPYTGWINVTGGVTGISDIKEERAESNDIYDLQGRKVTEPVKGGIYIQNGKKVMW